MLWVFWTLALLGHRSLRCDVGTSTTQQFHFVVLPKNPQHNNLKLLCCGFSGRWHLWATVLFLLIYTVRIVCSRVCSVTESLCLSVSSFAGRSGRVLSASDCGVRGPRFESRRGQLCFHDGLCNMQPLARAARLHYCSVYVDSAFHPSWDDKMSISLGAE